VPTDTRLTEELAQYRALGVGVLQGGAWTGRAVTGRFADLDTAKEGGGMTLALANTTPTKRAIRRQRLRTRTPSRASRSTRSSSAMSTR
jgi:hypothetical protein